jgi:SAM-dependent MidA family methyltransferase
MADALRAIAKVPGMRDAAGVHLVEASPALRARQMETLRGVDVTWHDRIEDLPEGPLYLVANEFFDALPIRQFLRSGQGWRERHVGVAGGKLAPGFGPETGYGFLVGRLGDTTEGEVVELCPALPAIAGDIACRITANGGVALAIDYGDWHSRGDTLQALRGHQPDDPFAAPGEADLTAHVDFEALALAFTCAGAASTAMTAQGPFLDRLGIAARAEALARGLSGTVLQSHLAAHRRLTDPGEMGQLFKAIACFPSGAPMPPGLDPLR